MLYEAIILAGGRGTRLRELVPDVPKPMAPVAGRPFLEILLAFLGRKGFRRVILSLGYKAERISAHFGDRFLGLDLEYVIEEKALGTGGAVKLAMDLCEDDHVFVFNGDTFLDLDVGAVEQQWLSNQCPIVVGRYVDDTSRYGRLVVEGDRITGFIEKGVEGAGMINAGCYVLNKGQLANFPSRSSFSLEDYLSEAVNQIRIEFFATRGYFIDIGVPDDYKRAQVKLLGFMGG